MSLHVWFHLSEPLPVWCSEHGLFSLQTLICTGKQDQPPDDTVTFSLPTLPVCLTSPFQSLYILISPCENVKSSVSLSPPAPSAFLSSVWASITPFPPCSLLLVIWSAHLCLCVCCRPLPSPTQLRQTALNFNRLHQPGCCLTLFDPPHWCGMVTIARRVFFVFFLSFTREKMNLVIQECTAVDKMIATPEEMLLNGFALSLSSQIK